MAAQRPHRDRDRGKPAKKPSTAVDLDAEVLKSLAKLSPDSLLDFSKCEAPPPKILAWLRRANASQIDGLLIAVLRQWHKQRRQDVDES